MNLKNIFFGLMATFMTLCLTGCDEEKDPIIIEGDLPIPMDGISAILPHCRLRKKMP